MPSESVRDETDRTLQPCCSLLQEASLCSVRLCACCNRAKWNGAHVVPGGGGEGCTVFPKSKCSLKQGTELNLWISQQIGKFVAIIETRKVTNLVGLTLEKSPELKSHARFSSNGIIRPRHIRIQWFWRNIEMYHKYYIFELAKYFQEFFRKGMFQYF